MGIVVPEDSSAPQGLPFVRAHKRAVEAMQNVADGKLPRGHDSPVHASCADYIFKELSELFHTPLFRTFAIDAAKLQSGDSSLLHFVSPDSLTILRSLLELNKDVFPFSLENSIRYQERMLCLVKSSFSASVNDMKDGRPNVSIVYNYAVGHTASILLADVKRLECGDFWSRMVADTEEAKRGNIVPWSFIMALKVAAPLIRHYVDTGQGDKIVYIFYVGMSDAQDSIGRLFAHGTKAGCSGTREFYRRKVAATCVAPRGPPSVLRGILAFVPRGLPGAWSPAAKLELLIGALTLALGGIRASTSTSSHGDVARLLDELIRPGKSPQQARAEVFAQETAKRIDLLSSAVSEETNIHMRVHLEEAARTIQIRNPDASVTLFDAYSALLTRRKVNFIYGNATRAGGVAAAAAAAIADAAVAVPREAPPPTLPASDGLFSPVTKVEWTKETRAIFARAGLSRERIEELIHHLERIGKFSSLNVEVAYLFNLPVTLTSGRPIVSPEDVETLKATIALNDRGGSVVSSHIMHMLLGPYQRAGWTKDPVIVFDAQGNLRKLCALIVPPLALSLYKSHPAFRHMMIIDATFGLSLMNIEVFQLLWVHPVSNRGFPLGVFLRLQGTGAYGDEAANKVEKGIKIDDLNYMRRALNAFGIHDPTVEMTDKDAAFPASQALHASLAWIKATQSVGGPTMPFFGDLVSAPPALPPTGPPTLHSSSPSADVKVDILSLARALAPFAFRSDAAASFEAYSAYMATEKGTTHDIDLLAELQVPLPDGQPFGLWGKTYPRLVPGRARSILNAVTSVAAAAPSWESPADVARSLADLQRHSFALGDTPLADFSSVLIHRTSLLCYFHAAKAMREWLFHKRIIPSEEMKSVWESELHPAIEELFLSSRDNLDTKWSHFRTQFNDRFPAFVTYMDSEWMSPKWRDLWTKAGRYHVAHFMTDTSNIAETFFRTFKHDILRSKMPTDLVEFLNTLFGSPLDSESQSRCYLQKMYLELVSLYKALESRELSNSRLPSRVRIDKMREKYAAFSGLDAVQELNSCGLYRVASASGRKKLVMDLDMNNFVDGDSYVVDLFRNRCPCNDRSDFCKHILRARYYHLFHRKHPRTWMDAELSLVWPLEYPSTLLTPAAMARALSADDENSAMQRLVHPTAAEVISAAGCAYNAFEAGWGGSVRAVDSARLCLRNLSHPHDASLVDVALYSQKLEKATRFISASNSLRAAAASLAGDTTEFRARARARPDREGPGGGERIAAARARALAPTPTFSQPKVRSRAYSTGSGSAIVRGVTFMGQLPSVTLIEPGDRLGGGAGSIRVEAAAVTASLSSGSRRLRSPPSSPQRCVSKRRTTSATPSSPLRDSGTVGVATVPTTMSQDFASPASHLPPVAAVAPSKLDDLVAVSVGEQSDSDPDEPTCQSCNHGPKKPRGKLVTCKECYDESVLYCTRRSCLRSGKCMSCCIAEMEAKGSSHS